MEFQTFSRSNSLNNIPERKFNIILSELDKMIENDSSKINAISALKTSFIRYYESNIPIEYWRKSMEKDFVGNIKLKEAYDNYIEDVRKSFISGKSMCFSGLHGVGKQLCLETEIPTPDRGFVKLKDLEEGDQLFDENGNICNIIKLHPIQISPESYRITFDDGSIIDACADHLWETYTRKNRVNKTKPSVKTTKEILNTLRFNNGKRWAANHSIPCTQPLNYVKKELLISPYVLGCWLGDGTTLTGNIESEDDEIISNIEKLGYKCFIYNSTLKNNSKSNCYRVGNLINDGNGHNIGLLKFHLRKLKLLGNKHIPFDYLHSSFDQRLQLLCGLMDTDGSCLKNGQLEFSSKLKVLAEGVCQLVRSFGIKTKVKKNKAFLNGKECGFRYRVNFVTTLPVFKLSRKLHNIRTIKAQKNRTLHRYIINIEKIKSKPMRCLTVDSESHLFLVTRNFIPTHNTMTACNILKKVVEKGYNGLYTTLSDVVHVLTKAPQNEVYLARKELLEIDFVIIDEFDSRFMATENASDLFARSLESVFRTRSQNKMPTLLCTNSPNIVNAFNGPLKESIDSLLKGYVSNVVIIGDDYRKRDK